MKTRSLILSTLAVFAITSAAKADIDQSITAILQVEKEGEGNAAASGAWQNLAEADMTAVPAILRRIQDANPLAANYLRSAVETIVSRELESGGDLPIAALGEFLLDTREDPQARRFAFELIRRNDPDTAEKLIPGMLNDPSNELRRDAVQRLIDQGDTLVEDGSNQSAILIYRQALSAARDVDQINDIAKSLRELDQEVDLPRHFGFLMHWNIIGPFDNTDREGFDTEFPPEREIDLEATYNGKEGEVTWQEFVTTDEYGVVDFNKPYGLLKEVVAYAHTEFNSAEEQPVELRLGGKNAWKVWLNGELLFGRDEYHRGARIDQYIMRARMKKGPNTILVKCCQNEQEQDWTVQWNFQLRVCDSTGTAVLSTDRPPTPKPEKARRRPAGNE